MKTKVLAVTENPLNATGLGVYANELLKRLNCDESLEIAALSCFGVEDLSSLPYKTWSCNKKNFPGMSGIFKNMAESKDGVIGFGYFEKVLLEYQPDVVISWRDFEQDYFIGDSPYRKCFKYIAMPTVDSENRPSYELDYYKKCDALMFYSKFGYDVLNREANIENIDSYIASPAADYSIFSPIDLKGLHKLKNGFGYDDIIIGTCNRNQSRKLFPALIEAFSLALKEIKESIAKRMRLYLHTSYPDVSWNIPELLMKANILTKTYLTYNCKACRKPSISNYCGASELYCDNCGTYNLGIINSAIGVNREDLANIYNLFDLFVQPTSNEGFGMPLLEAASCGVPVLGNSYTATEYILNSINGDKLTPLFYTEPIMERKLSIIDVKELKNKIIEYANMPCPLRRKIGYESALLSRQNFSYDKTAENWKIAIKSVGCGNWNLKPNNVILNHINNLKHLSNEEFVEYYFGQFNSLYKKLKILNDLNSGLIDREKVYSLAIDYVEVYNYWEKLRDKKDFSNRNS